MNWLLVRLLFSPSLLSGLITAGMSVLILVTANWSYAISDPLVSRYLFDPDGLLHAIQNTPGGPNELLAVILSDDFTYNIGVVVIAIAFGTVTYTIIDALDHSLLGAMRTWSRVQEADISLRKIVRKELFQRSLLRIAGIISWCFYLFIFVNIIAPFCILAARLSFDRLSWGDIGYAMLGFGILFIALHINVIFIRFIALQPRIGGIRSVLIARRSGL